MFPNINHNSVFENDLTPRIGVVSQVDLANDLPPRICSDSWFGIGRVEADDHKLNYLFHIMQMPIPIFGGCRWEVCYSFLDETSVYYVSGDHFYSNKEAECGKDHFHIKLPNAEMSGTWDEMKIYLKEADFEIDTITHAVHYPLYTRGSAVFDLFGMVLHQYSVPYMKTIGTVKLQGKTYTLTENNAVSWFDRQWQRLRMTTKAEWTWMAIYLDNGEIISILDAVGKTDTPRFMTVLKTDGSQLHSTNFKPFSESETRRWNSKKSGQSYGTRWDLELYDFDAKLHIEPIIEKQEIISKMKRLSKYEGSATITGTYEGKPITGRATVEIIKV